jgi:N-acetylneuraminate synthase
MTTLDFGGRLVGDGQPAYIVAELGYNWAVSADPERNREELAALIRESAKAGADCVKLQLRDLATPAGYYASKGEALDKPIDDPRSPWRTRRAFVEAREPDREVLDFVAGEAAAHYIHWTASPWDVPSVRLLAEYAPPWVKVASASITDHDVLREVAGLGVPVVMSTGMCGWRDVVLGLNALGSVERVVLSHTTSSYPCPDEDVNLEALSVMRKMLGLPVGYSGHEAGIALTFAARVMGACWLERHFTLDRAHWHKDHAASLEPDGLRRLVRDVRRYENALGDGVKRVMPSEAAFLGLRRVT